MKSLLQQILLMKPITEHQAKTQELASWRTFPMFISSTFVDMQAERDHLKNIILSLVEKELQCL